MEPGVPDLTTDQLRAYWAMFNVWLCQASDDEADQLEASLSQQNRLEDMPLKLAITMALRDETSRQALPRSLVQQVEAAYWLPAQASG